MALFLTVPATLSIVLAVRQLGSGAAWQTWLSFLLVSSVALTITWPALREFYQRNLGQWLSFLALFAIPGSIVFGIIQVVGYGAAGGPVLNALGALLAWIVLGILSGFVLGRLVVLLYGFPE